ncbi:MAG: M23 family metallopeptidase [Candidatus Cloacimonetes bacterium]|nr:M23 family metallopeptidase [Candidatus Cloacimonadota bacterium]MBL7085814.1 M23 family metallopeptidase [Candidatus Cloacimonadota bacterium]
MKNKTFFSIIILVSSIFIILSGCTKKQLEEVHEFINIAGKIRKGESLFSTLLEKNVDRKEAFKITKSLNKYFDLRYTHPNDSFAIQIDTLGQVQRLEYFPNKIEKYIVIRDTLDDFITHKKEVELSKEIFVLSSQIQSSIYQSMVNQGVSPELVMNFSDIFQWDIDFFIDPREGDSCKLVYEAFTNNGKILKYGDILAASYKGKNFDLTAYYFFDDGKNANGYFDKDGISFQKAFLKSPLNYSYISSYFSYARYHPILKKVCPHYGIDYAAPYGTPIVASADGKVVFKGWNNGFGHCIKIRHKNSRYVTLYGHLSGYARGIYVGANVKQKQLIGYVGSTGWSTGPHLDYRIYDNGRAINPLKLKNVSGPPIPKKIKKDFMKIVLAMNEMLENDILENKKNQKN